MDAIKLEVIYNATNQIAYELTQKLMRNGYSSIVKESQDLALSICDRQGRNVGQYSPNPVGLGVVGSQLKGILQDFAIGEGDTFILNHPYHYCQNHPSDVTLISPVFHEGEIIAFVGNTAHKPDIGGKVPGTNAGDATEVFQEGLLIPPLKLYEAGVLNDAVKQLICANTRTPEVTWGDIRAQVTSNLHGIDRLTALVDRFGLDDVLACWDERIAITERELRSAQHRDHAAGHLRPGDPTTSTMTAWSWTNPLQVTADAAHPRRRAGVRVYLVETIAGSAEPPALRGAGGGGVLRAGRPSGRTCPKTRAAPRPSASPSPPPDTC